MSDENNAHISKLTQKMASRYIDAVILGLNDALVELTGALAGFTIGLHNSKLIILAGITTGVAATLSMTASEFLAKEVDTSRANSYFAAFCTGSAYLITTAILLFPFLIFPEPFTALIVSFIFAVMIIAGFTYCASKIRHEPFVSSFLKMVTISLSVAVLSFLISWLAKTWWNIDV